MTRSITSTDVNIPSSDTNDPIQTREISSTTTSIQPIFQSVRKRKNSSSASLESKVIRINHEEENRIYKAEIDRLFNKMFAFCEKQTAPESFPSEKKLNKILNSLFIKTLLKEIKKEGMCNYLEQDPCCGEYWKELHAGSDTAFSLQDLQKLYLCLESFIHPIPDTAEEMLVLIKAKLIVDLS